MPNGSAISGVLTKEAFPDHSMLPTGVPFDSRFIIYSSSFEGWLVALCRSQVRERQCAAIAMHLFLLRSFYLSLFSLDVLFLLMIELHAT